MPVFISDRIEIETLSQQIRGLELRICCSVVFLFLMAQIVPAESKRFSVSGYGVISYANFYWETDPDRRAHIDVERLVVAPKLQINDTIRLESELEFEHGGTGITMEFDKFEEFGEFEMEVEKGGEIIVEKPVSYTHLTLPTKRIV